MSHEAWELIWFIMGLVYGFHWSSPVKEAIRQWISRDRDKLNQTCRIVAYKLGDIVEVCEAHNKVNNDVKLFIDYKLYTVKLKVNKIDGEVYRQYKPGMIDNLN